MGDDENSCFKLFLDVYNHLGEVHLKTTVFIIPFNFSYNNIVKRSIPGTPLGGALLLAVRGAGPHPDDNGHLETT